MRPWSISPGGVPDGFWYQRDGRSPWKDSTAVRRAVGGERVVCNLSDTRPSPRRSLIANDSVPRALGACGLCWERQGGWCLGGQPRRRGALPRTNNKIVRDGTGLEVSPMGKPSTTCRFPRCRAGTSSAMASVGCHGEGHRQADSQACGPRASRSRCSIAPGGPALRGS